MGVRLEILDENLKPVPKGTVGRIFVGNDITFDGYTNGDDKERYEGLVCSGDVVGHFDENGLLFVDGRDDDMIVSGGENVFPREVEDLLCNHDKIHEVAVIGVKDPEWGQCLRAYAVAAEGKKISGDELKAYVKTNLASYKVPRETLFLHAPSSASVFSAACTDRIGMPKIFDAWLADTRPTCATS